MKNNGEVKGWRWADVFICVQYLWLDAEDNHIRDTKK
jgi:hypothetical protein